MTELNICIEKVQHLHGKNSHEYIKYGKILTVFSVRYSLMSVFFNVFKSY